MSQGNKTQQAPDTSLAGLAHDSLVNYLVIFWNTSWKLCFRILLVGAFTFNCVHSPKAQLCIFFKRLGYYLCTVCLLSVS